MAFDVDEEMEKKIAETAKDPEQAARVSTMFDMMRRTPMPFEGGQPQVNMFDMCAAMCAAAFCVGKDPNCVLPRAIATNARAVASNLFNKDGTPIKPNDK